MTGPSPTPSSDRTLGQVLHEAREAGGQGRPRPWPPLPWAERDPGLKALDEEMAGAVAAVVRDRFRAALRERITRALREHYLAGISCDRARHEDNPVCACSRVFLGWHPSVGAAVEAWIGHVMEAAGQERTDEKEARDGTA